MNAILNTQSELCSLSMKGIEIYPDESGGSCDLDVLSGSFSACMKFFFDFPSLEEFISDLEILQRDLLGNAKLGNRYEEPYIEFHGSGLGHITVRGLLVEYSEHSQKLNFSFATDQTALASFVDGLKGTST